ncbi:RecQ family zinc-binding domain-containing protein, partial [Anaerobium acetethylicum]|uniref:RecQ family zinc-binding domain-containing protein n=1 Tax=Anaerobium acetethylicum TaxID=1619234 RepID=UPI001FA7B1E5
WQVEIVVKSSIYACFRHFLECYEYDGFGKLALIQQRDARRLQAMEGYCRTTNCLRNYILEYFGEKTGAPCDNCGNCHREYQEVDMT